MQKTINQFFQLLFPNTFWVTETNIVSYFPRPWNCMRWKGMRPPMLLHSLKGPPDERGNIAIAILWKRCKNKTVRQFFLLWFPNTFWVTKADIISYFPKPCNCMRWKTNLYESPMFPCFCTHSKGSKDERGNLAMTILWKPCQKTVSRFSSAIVSKQIMGHENRYCFICF